jgi:hypothetical protein
MRKKRIFMIPKSGLRFSDQIMRKRDSMIPKIASREIMRPAKEA